MKRYVKHLVEWLFYCVCLIALAVAALALLTTASVFVTRVTTSDADAYRICSAIGGPNAWFFYDKNGKLVCTNKRGYRLGKQP